MSRALTAGTLAAMQAKSVAPVIFVQAQFASGTIYVWSGIGQVSWNSQVWTGLGKLGKITQISETTKNQAKGVTLELSGIPSDILTDVLTEVRPQYPAMIWIGYMDLTTFTVIANPEQRWAGRIDTVRITEGGDTSTIQLAVESKLIDLQRARARYYTHQDQQIDYPGDNGFAYVNGIQNLQDIWGKPGSQLNNLPSFITVAPPPTPPSPPGRPYSPYNPYT